MKVFFSSRGFVDFEAPVHMSDSQLDRFIAFMQEMFPGRIEVRDVDEKTKEGGPTESKIKDWGLNELHLLVGSGSNEHIGKKLDRTIMSVKMKRGNFVPSFMVWAKRNGCSLPPRKEDLKRFVEETGHYENRDISGR